MIENLVFQGTGVRIGAEIGAYYALSSKGLLSNLKRVGGTSAGSITACLIALGYSPDEMKALIASTDFSKFEDGNIFDKIAAAKYFGINPGRAFLSYIQNLIEKKTGNPGITFSELRKLSAIDLHVFATDLDTQDVKEFCDELTPNVKVCDGVRASMSIPGVFIAYEIDGVLFMDGGCVMNYPIRSFDNVSAIESTIGICFKWQQGNDHVNYGQDKKALECLLNSILNSQQVLLNTSPSDLKRSIQCSTLGISAINFKLTEADKQNLFESGVKAVNDYFNP